MTRRIGAAAVLLIVAFVTRAETRGAVDWILVVDTSKSMRGVGGTQNIFNDVKASLDSFVRQASDGDSITLYSFDRDVHLLAPPTVAATGRADLHAIVDALPAEGDRTHLGKAIRVALERAASLRAQPDPSRVRSIVLFTDGKEDVRGIADPVPILSNVDRVGDSYVFFVSMGAEHEAKLEDFRNATQRTTVLRAPTHQEIADVTRQIRTIVATSSPTAAKPTPPPRKHAAPRPAPPPEPSPFRWLVPLAVAAAAALFGVARHRKNHQLEGELEILKPRPSGDAVFVGLPRLAAREVALSNIVPVEALGGGDARLFVRRRKGEKTVWIAASGGSLRVNDVETPMSELYDADTIAIGDAKLRFNRVGFSRRQEDL